MRAARFACLLVVSLVVLPACDDDSVVTPLSVVWLEWSDSVAAGAPFGVRTYVLTYSPADLRVRVQVVGDTVTIEPYQVGLSCPDACGNAAPAPYDTLVWVPAIAATVPRVIVLRAPYMDFASPPPWPVRTFGKVTVSPSAPVSPLMMHSVGKGSGFQGSFGCYLILNPSHIYISKDQPPAWAPGFTGFVYGRVDPVLASTCLIDVPVIVVDSIAG